MLHLLKVKCQRPNPYDSTRHNNKPTCIRWYFKNSLSGNSLVFVKPFVLKRLWTYYSDKRIDDTDNTTVVVKIVFNLYPDVRIRTIMSICFINNIIKTKNIFGAFGISFIGLEYCSHIINSIVIHLSSDSDYKKYSWRQEIWKTYLGLSLM